MEVILLSIPIVAASVAGLAVGVLFRRQPLEHSCGSAICADGTGCACGRGQTREPAR